MTNHVMFLSKGLTIVKTRKTLFFWVNFYKKGVLNLALLSKSLEFLQTEYKQITLLDNRYILCVEVRFVGTVGNLDPVIFSLLREYFQKTTR